MLITHGGGCGASYAPAEPPLEDASGTLDAIPVPLLDNSYVEALRRGFAVMSTALANTGHNCNVAHNAESLMMAKERLVERYGTIRYTIGTGCSGGSVAQHTVANAYPGIYQGLVTTCSYPDVMSPGSQFADYHLMRAYFENPATWGPGVVWSPTQMADVEGHLTPVNAVTADEGLFKSAINPEHACAGVPEPVAGDTSTRFDSDTNPGGVRCDILTLMRNQLGPRPESVWSAQEKAVGHGLLRAARSATRACSTASRRSRADGSRPSSSSTSTRRSAASTSTPTRSPCARRATPASIANAYRTGLLNEFSNTSEIAMINHGGPDPGIAHDYAHAVWSHLRLQRSQGHTDNRVEWFGPTPLLGDVRWPTEAFIAMDGWLARVEKDGRSVPLAEKIVEDKPASLTDRCLADGVPGVVCRADIARTNLSTPAPGVRRPGRQRRPRLPAEAARPVVVPAARRPAGALHRRAVEPPAGRLPRRRLRVGAARHRAGPGEDVARLRHRDDARSTAAPSSPAARRARGWGGSGGRSGRCGGSDGPGTRELVIRRSDSRAPYPSPVNEQQPAGSTPTTWRRPCGCCSRSTRCRTTTPTTSRSSGRRRTCTRRSRPSGSCRSGPRSWPTTARSSSSPRPARRCASTTRRRHPAGLHRAAPSPAS